MGICIKVGCLNGTGIVNPISLYFESQVVSTHLFLRWRKIKDAQDQNMNIPRRFMPDKIKTQCYMCNGEGLYIMMTSRHHQNEH